MNTIICLFQKNAIKELIFNQNTIYGQLIVFLHTYKAILCLLAILTLFASSVKAQSDAGSVTVNIIFRPVQTITVSPEQKVIDLSYNTVDDHQDGVSVTVDNHLTVFSTGGFLVSVEATSDHFTRLGGSETIPVSDVVIRPTGGSDGSDSGSSGSGTVFSDAILSSSPAPLITSDKGGRDLKYDITYDNSVAGSAQHYINRYESSDGAATVYTSNITYTITTP